MLLADGWAEGEGLGMDVRGVSACAEGEGAEGEGGEMGFEFVRGGEGVGKGGVWV